jgi:hypothetical protein
VHLAPHHGGLVQLGHGGVPQGAQQELVPVAVANAPMGWVRGAAAAVPRAPRCPVRLPLSTAVGPAPLPHSILRAWACQWCSDRLDSPCTAPHPRAACAWRTCRVTHLQMAPPHLALAYQLGGMSLGGPPSGAQGGHGPHVGHTQQLVQQQGGYIGGGGGGGGVYGAPLGGGGYGQQVATAAQPVMVIGTESKTVKIRGLPFRATPLDIFNFFEGCAPTAGAYAVVHAPPPSAPSAKPPAAAPARPGTPPPGLTRSRPRPPSGTRLRPVLLIRNPPGVMAAYQPTTLSGLALPNSNPNPNSSPPPPSPFLPFMTSC